MARDSKRRLESARAEAEYLARHFQLDEKGRLDSSESGTKMSFAQREAKQERLTNFPVMPEGERERLEGLIKRYGLPLAALSSDTAAFVVRRVMLDWFKLNVLRRAIKPGLFTQEELIELMRELQVQPSGLAEMVDPARKGPMINMIHRWLHGVNRPVGLGAIRVNRLIEQHVRRKKSAGGTPRGRGTYSIRADTIDRRNRWRASQHVTDAPVSRAAKEATDEAP